MKSITTINIAKTLIKIDTDAFASIEQYLAAFKKHYAAEPSGDEIYNDIEARVAEIMLAKLAKGNASISIEDVQEIQLRIGSLKELGIEDGEQQTTEQSTINNASSHAHQSHQTYTGPKKLQRNENEKIISGVCAGIANYINTDPIWVRLLFILLATTGLSIVAYIILSFALQSTYSTAYSGKRLMRDTQNKSIGGVCAGLAKYLNTETSNMRIMFAVAFVLFSIWGVGSGLFHFEIPVALIYLLLWILLPEAKTSNDRLAMQGKEATALNIQKSVYEKSQVPQNLSLTQNNGCLGFIKTIVTAGLWLIAGIIGFATLSISLGFLFAGGSFSIISNYILKNQLQNVFAFVGWILFCGAPLTAVAYSVYAIISGKRKNLGTVYGNLAIAWFAGVLCMIYVAFMLRSDFKVRAFYNKPQVETKATDSIIHINANDYKDIKSRLNLQFGVLRSNFSGDSAILPLTRLLINSNTQNNITIMQEISSYGETVSEAEANAKLVSDDIEINDNSIGIKNAYTLHKNDIFRGQLLTYKINIPEGQRVTFNKAAAALFNTDKRWEVFNYEIGFRYSENTEEKVKPGFIYQMSNGKLVNIGKLPGFVEEDTDVTDEKKEALEELKHEIQEKIDEVEETLQEATEELNSNRETTSSIDTIVVNHVNQSIEATRQLLNRLQDSLKQVNSKLMYLIDSNLKKQQSL